ncbi:MAG: GDP-L-fucose synthase [Candidatus Babeliaceae bacterium]
MMEKSAKIYIAGHQGLVGSALMRLLHEQGFEHQITQTIDQLDLRIQADVEAFFWAERPAYVFVAAARVGGIKANSQYPAQFLYDNLMIATNIIHAAHQFEVKKLLFLGSSCIYPRSCSQPIQESALLTGPLEKTNEAYALAKIAGIKMCQTYQQQFGNNFISCMPTNLYGPHDTFDEESGHVIPALIAKMVRAHMHNEKEVIIWGTGVVRREFLYVDDCAQALLLLMQEYNSSETINVGYGTDITIEQLAYLIKEIVGYKGVLIFDANKPEGTPQKLLDTTRIRNVGWSPKTSLQEGLEMTIAWYKKSGLQKNNIMIDYAAASSCAHKELSL